MMYVRTGQGFGQVRMVYGQLSGSLGDQDLQRRITEAIEGERRNNKLPNLLIDISVNPFPKNHGLFVDFKLMNNLSGQEDQVLTALTKAHDDLYKTDPSYRQRADAEWDLRNQVRQAITALSFQQIRPFLLDALVSPIFAKVAGEQSLNNLTIVNAFAKKLPRALNQRLDKSAVKFSHLTYIGSLLQSTAVLHQNRDPAFKRQVEAARARMFDAQKRREEQKKRQEQLRRQRIRQQKKPNPPPKRKMTLKDI